MGTIIKKPLPKIEARGVDVAVMSFFTGGVSRRAKNIYEQDPGAISKQDVDKYQAAEDEAEAAVKASQANLESYKIYLLHPSDLADRRQSKPLLLHHWQPGQPGQYTTDQGRLPRIGESMLLWILRCAFG
jgi:hypothetical protein